MRLPLSFAAVFIVTPVWAADFPENYWGIWQVTDGKSETCKISDWHDGDPNSDRFVSISGHNAQFYETACTLASLTVTRKGTSAVTLSCTDEGETWKLEEFWRVETLEPSQILIMARPSDVSISTYRRCR